MSGRGESADKGAPGGAAVVTSHDAGAERPLVAILAGGAGRRLGGAKALARLEGRPLVEYPLASARGTGLEVVVLAKPSTALPELDCEVTLEPEQPRHPLCGIVAGMRRGGGRPVIVLACDMPFVTAPLITWLASLQGSAVTELSGRTQPLLARYSSGARAALERALREGVPARVAVARLRARRVDERVLRRFGRPQTLCFNVNEPSDLARAKRELAALRARPEWALAPDSLPHSSDRVAR
jgi:molybdopterin-guanine dinucleotide biosynthesis protein A